MTIRDEAAKLYRETGSKTNPDFPFYSNAQRRGVRVRCGNLAGKIDQGATADDYYALVYLDVVAFRLNISITPGEKGYSHV